MPALKTTEGTQRFELENGWEFLPDPSGRMRYSDLAAATQWREARAGISWNVQFDDLREYMGAAWYRIHIDVPAFSDVRHVLLKFGAVDYFCEVFVNGQSVGIHEGGYTPFTMEITHSVRLGQNEVAIRVVDPPMDEQQNRELFPEWMYHEIPHGKQNWYVQNSGIWQGVRVEFCPSIYIDRLDVTSDISGAFKVAVRIAGIGMVAQAGAATEGTNLSVVIYDNAGRPVFKEQRALGDEHDFTITGKLQEPKLWGPTDAHLYMVEGKLTGAVTYKRCTKFGIREFAARDGKLYLNGRPFYMISALDQDFYPETIHTPYSEESVRDMMLKARRLGINVLRCHLKVAHPVYLDVADELGMLVWTEMPSWSDAWFPSDHFSTIAAVRGEKMFAEIVARDWNHPCIVIHTIMNESWGINLQSAEQRQWLKETFDRVKATLAPAGRLVIDNSPCEGNFHVKSDIEDFHNYYSMPDQAELWEKFINGLASRPDWTYSPFGDAERTREEPIVVSEFGNWGLPKLPRDLPWWFNSSFGNREATRPAGVLERFRKYKFDTIFRNYDELAEQTQWHQFISLKHEIESIRSHAAIQGYVVTGMTDIHWEVNGLLDMWRHPKVFDTELAHLQQQDMVVARVPRYTSFAGDEVVARVFVSHYSDKALDGVKLKWWTESGSAGEIPLTEPPSQGTTVELAPIRFNSVKAATLEVERLHMELRTKQGRRLAENFIDLFVLARPEPLDFGVSIHDPLGELDALEGAIRRSEEASQRQTLLISSVYDSTVEEHLHQGGRAMVIVGRESVLAEHLGIEVKIREGTEYDGRWFSNFNWVRNEQVPFVAASFGPILGFESAAVVPRYVLKNIAAENFNDVLAGATYGWLNLNVALAFQANVERGKVLFTTFDFSQVGTDAYASRLFDSLARYVVSPEFAPKTHINAGREAQAR